MAGLLTFFRDWMERRRAIKEFTTRSGAERENDHFAIKDRLTLASQALEGGDSATAEAYWEDSVAKFPKETRESRLALKILLGLRRFDEAEELMRNGMKSRPADAYYAVGFAEIAHTKRDFEVAAERWAFVRKRFPGQVIGFSYGSEALRMLDRKEEAKALAQRATKQFPDDIGPYMAVAQMAIVEQDWESALQWWDQVRERFQHAMGYAGAAQALAKLGRFEEADALLKSSFTRFGTDPATRLEYARCAHARGDKAETIERWKAALYRFPLFKPLYFEGAASLVSLGATKEGIEILQAAAERFKTDPQPLQEIAKLYHFSLLDFEAAAQAWATLREKFPDNKLSYTLGTEALERANRREEAQLLRSQYKARFE